MTVKVRNTHGEYFGIKIGDHVQLTRQQSINHFQSAGMGICGVVTRIDNDHFMGNHHRPLFITFDDRPNFGEWSYALSEIEKVEVTQ